MAELGEQRDESGAAGRLGEGLVEPAAQRARILTLAPAGPFLAQPDQAPEHLQMGFRAAPRGACRTQRLQEHPHLQEVGGLLHGGLGDTGAGCVCG